MRIGVKKQIGIALLLALLLTGCGKQTAAPAPTLLEPVDAAEDTARVTRGDLLQAEVFAGDVAVYTEPLAFSVHGKLDALLVAVGDRVEQGQTLATLDCDGPRRQIETLQNQLSMLESEGVYTDRQNQADVDIAREELAALEESGAAAETCRVKQAEIDLLTATAEQAKEERAQQAESLQARIAEQEAKIAESTLTAPFAGTVALVVPDMAQAASSGGTLLYLADETKRTVRSDFVSAASLSRVARIYARIGTNTYDLTYQPLDAASYLEMVQNRNSIRMLSEFTLNDPDAAVEPGQFAAVFLEQAARQDVLTVPVNALYQDGDGWYVYRMEAGRRVRQTVSVGLVTDTQGEILAGLTEGETVYVGQ